MGGSNSKKRSKIRVEKFITLGLYGAGKSTFTYRLAIGEIPDPDKYWPTEVDPQMIHVGDATLHAWEGTGRGEYRVWAKFYYQHAAGIIFMIDSADPDNFDESLEYLNSIFKDEDLTNMTLMVVANKQDLDDAVGPDVIEDMIKKKCRIGPGFSVFVMPMAVTTEDDHSMQLAFRLFVKTMQRKYRQNNTVPRGLIRRAWETAEKDAQDTDDDNEEDEDEEIDHGTADETIKNNNDVKVKDKKKTEDKGGDVMPVVLSEKTKFSCFKDPVHLFKSLLTR